MKFMVILMLGICLAQRPNTNSRVATCTNSSYSLGFNYTRVSIQEDHDFTICSYLDIINSFNNSFNNSLDDNSLDDNSLGGSVVILPFTYNDLRNTLDISNISSIIKIKILSYLQNEIDMGVAYRIIRESCGDSSSEFTGFNFSQTTYYYQDSPKLGNREYTNLIDLVLGECNFTGHLYSCAETGYASIEYVLKVSEKSLVMSCGMIVQNIVNENCIPSSCVEVFNKSGRCGNESEGEWKMGKVLFVVLVISSFVVLVSLAALVFFYTYRDIKKRALRISRN